MTELSLDQILGDSRPASALTERELASNEMVQRMLVRREWEVVEKMSVYSVQKALENVEEIAEGNILVTGRVLDEALTGFMCLLQAEMGTGFAADAAGLLIHNLALFLRPEQKMAVQMAVARPPRAAA